MDGWKQPIKTFFFPYKYSKRAFNLIHSHSECTIPFPFHFNRFHFKFNRMMPIRQGILHYYKLHQRHSVPHRFSQQKLAAFCQSKIVESASCAVYSGSRRRPAMENYYYLTQLIDSFNSVICSVHKNHSATFHCVNARASAALENGLEWDHRRVVFCWLRFCRKSQ